VGSKNRQARRNKLQGQRNGQPQAGTLPVSTDGPPPADSVQTLAQDIAEAVEELSQERYDSERKLLLDLLKANIDQHDKAVLQLASATLGISVTFVDKIAPDPVRWTYWLLGGGWLALAGSIALMLASFQTGVKGATIQINKLDQHMRTGKRPDQTNRWNPWTSRLTSTSSVLFLVGFGLVAAFSWYNLPSSPSKAISQEGPQVAPQRPSVPRPPATPTAQPKPDNGIPAPSAPAMPARPTTPTPPKK
jgi:hypothetical protein